MLGDSASELIDEFGTETFKAVHDSDQDGLVYFRGDGGVQYANRAALEMFGLEADVIGENIFDLVEENSSDLAVDVLFPSDHFDKARETFEHGVPTRSEMIIVDGGDRREVEVVWGPVERDGSVTGVVGSYRDVSPRPDIHDQLTHEASRLNEQRRVLASVIELLDDGILVFDGSATLQLANPSAVDLLGLEAPVEGLDLEDLLAGSNLGAPERFAQQLRSTASSDGSGRKTHFVNLGDGEIRRVAIEMTHAGYDSEQVICTLSDCTQRIDIRQMELLSEIAALRAGPYDFEELGERAVASIGETLDVDFAVLTECREEELVPFAWRGVMLDRGMRVDVHRHPSIERILQEGAPARVDEWPWRRDAEDESVDQLVIPMVGREERVGTLHFGCVPSLERGEYGLDALERAFTETLGHVLRCGLENARQTERRETEQSRLRALVETIPEGLLLYNRRGDVVLYNSRLVDMTDYEEWEDLNTDSLPFRMLGRDGESLPRSEWPLFRAVQHGESCSAEVVLALGHRRRDVLVDATPLEEGGRADDLFVATFRDIREQRKLNRRKDEFLSIASHELRSPLTPLTGVLQLARRQRERGDEVDLSLLTRAERQVSRLTRLIDGLLDLTRIETDRFDLETRELEVSAFVEDQVHPWRLHPKDVSLELSLPDGDIHAELDPDRINQVLTNIVDNAIEYSEPSEVVRIEVREPASEVEIVVEDDGVGMDEETVDRIFDRFYHGGENQGESRSMGLGLYICRQIVEQHDGEIAVESDEGEGTRVEIALPKEQSEAASGN